MVKQELVAEVNITRERGYLYFINKDGNIARVKMRQFNKDESKNLL